MSAWSVFPTPANPRSSPAFPPRGRKSPITRSRLSNRTWAWSNCPTIAVSWWPIFGLIEGAHLGHGLGIQFLRHIERTRLLVHLVDVSEASGRDPVRDFETVMEELASFSEDLVKKPMLVAASKMDIAQDPARVDALRHLAAERGLPFYEISSATGRGIDALKYAMAERILAVKTA